MTTTQRTAITHNSEPGPVIRIATLLLVLFSLLGTARAQNIQSTTGNTNSSVSVDSEIDPSNLGLNLRIMLARNPGRNGMDLPVLLQYSSKVWELQYRGAFEQPEMPGMESTITEGAYSHNWTTNLTPPFITPDFFTYDQFGKAFDISWKEPPTSWFYVPRLNIKMSDGSTHELRKGDWIYEQFNGQPVAPWFFPGVYHTVDSSRMRFDTASNTLFLPDGSRYLFGPQLGGATAFIDRNGNTMTFESANFRWIDTMGRPINLPNLEGPSTPVDRTYSVPGINNVPITVTFKWKYLQDARTDPSLPLRYVGDCVSVGETTPSLSPSLFQSSMPENYVRDLQGAPFNPVLLNEILFPNGASYKFTYNAWGEIDKITYPAGGYERFRYEHFLGTSFASGPYNQTNRGVVERWISVDGTAGSEVRYQYSSTNTVFNQHTVVTETAPDNTKTERVYKAQTEMSLYGIEDILVGSLMEERVFDSNGIMVRRRLKHYDVTGSLSSQRPFTTLPLPFANRNPRPIKEAEILLDPASATPRVSVKTFEYNAEQNVKFAKEYEFESLLNRSSAETIAINDLPHPVLWRTTEYSYLTGGSYANFQELVKWIKITDGQGRLHGFTEYFYDETTPTTYSGQIVGWTNPQTNARGNVTTMLRSIDATSSVQTKASYDMFGNEISATDGLNRSVTFEFSPTHHYAYQTRIITPPSDPNGLTGSSLPTETKTSYDFWSGAILTTTDANNQVTTLEHNDPMHRVTRITRPDGGWTAFSFNETPHNFFLRTTTLQDGVNTAEKYEFLDGLMRPRRKSINEGPTWKIVDNQYDSVGRVWRSSNPFRSSVADPSNPTGLLWTTNQFDALGRVTTATAADGGTVTTSYSNNAVTVTDPANKQVRSVADAAGNVIEVTEAPNSAAPFVTTYVYDAVGKLRKVTQQSQALGVTQNRYFMYDLLGRLIRVKHPEMDTNATYNTLDEISGNSSWSMKFEYDAEDNLKKLRDARGVVTTYQHDAYDRETVRSYEVPAGVGASPTINSYYDGVGVPGGIAFSTGYRTKVISSVSTLTVDEFDLMGRVKQTTQSIDGHSYTLRYDYDYAGHIIAQTYPSGRIVRNTFDRAARLTDVNSQAVGESVPKSYLSQILYEPHWGVKSFKLGNNLFGQNTYNDVLQKTTVKVGASVGDASVYQLDNFYTTPQIANNGNLHKQIITQPGLSNTQEFTYDAYDRVEEAKENSGNSWRQKFTYDRFANRRIDTDVTTPSLIGLNPSINASNNRLQGYGYDFAGNVTSDPQAHAYEYNASNLLSKYDNGVATYAYDGTDRRVKKTVAGVTTYYVYNVGGQLVAEYTTGTPEKGGTSYLVGDHTGTPRVITDSSGGVKVRRDYLPFGEAIPNGFGGRSETTKYGVPSTIKQQYTGKERDEETNLDYFGARYYSSVTGRFTSPDPMQASGVITDPQTWNRYAIVTNNPLKYIDIGGFLKRKKNGTHDIRKTGVRGGARHEDDRNKRFDIQHATVETDGGTTVEVQVSEDRDPRSDSNCHGLTFAEGEVWIQNDQVEKILDPKKGDGYVETSTPVVGDVVVYFDVDPKNSKNREAVHSATVTAVDDKGNVTEVSGLGGIDPSSSSTTPANGFNRDPGKGKVREIKYFHSNNRTDEERKANAERAKSYDKANGRVQRKEDEKKRKAREKEEKERKKQEKREKNKPKPNDGPRENDNGSIPGVDN